METPNPQTLKDIVLAKITSRDISMRPRIFYTLRLIGLLILSVAVLLLSVLIANYISFSIRINGHDTLLSYGPHGFLAFLHFFPWPILVLDVLFIAALQHMVRKFSFGYRKPVLYLFGLLFLSSIVAGLALDRETRVNDSLYEGAHRGHPSFVNVFYRGLRTPPPPGSGVCAHCTIIAITKNVLTAEDWAFGTSTPRTIVVPEDDPLLPSLKIGDVIFAFGREASGTLYAFGLRHGPPGPRPE